MKTTIKDVAKLAGVSDTSVSLAFRENSRISDKTRGAVLRAARELNYTPNLAARNLRGGISNTIGFIVNNITNPFYALMLKEAEKALEEKGFDMFAAGTGWNSEKELKLIRKMLQARVRGLIICFAEKDDRSVKLLESSNMPHIAVDSFPDFYRGAHIANDFEMCGRMMAEHFIEIGTQKPGIINSGPSMAKFSAFKKIFSSFEKHLNDSGIKIKKHNKLSHGLDIKSGQSAFKRGMENSFDADCVFCANDLCALGFMEEMGKHHLRAGKDIALAGIDDLEISSLDRISLTSIRQPHKKIALEAVENLLANISSPAHTVRKKLSPELIIRKTTSGFKNKKRKNK